MERREYEVMFRLEEDYWWYLGLRNLVFRYLNRVADQNKSAMILDAGCGTGKLLEMCKGHGEIDNSYREIGKGHCEPDKSHRKIGKSHREIGKSHRETSNSCRAYGLEFSADAFTFLKMRGLRNVVRSSICRIPFRDQAFHGVVSLDVLYHAGVENDEEALVEIHRVLKPGGMLILNLPAFEFLRSEHDLAVHTNRRYQTGELRQKLEKAGFSVQVITYRNTFLFPIAAAVRLIKKAIPKEGQGHTIKSDLSPLPSWANKLLYSVLFFENVLMFRGVTFPFGLSVFCVAKKSGQSVF
jgi:SAM-dependent methyltransferase